MAEYEGQDQDFIRQVKVQHDENIHAKGFDVKKSYDQKADEQHLNESGTDATKEWVLAVLKSGNPFTGLSRAGSPIYDFMKKYQMPVCDHVKFAEIATELTSSGLEAMTEEAKGNAGFLMLDATPSHDGYDFISRRFQFITQKGDFKVHFYGAAKTEDVGSEDEYRAHVENFATNFEFTLRKIEQPNLPSVELDKDTTYILGGGADLGPGGHNSFRNLFGKSCTGADVAHGVNNILTVLPKVLDSTRNMFVAVNKLHKELRKKSVRAVINRKNRNKEWSVNPHKPEKGLPAAIARRVHRWIPDIKQTGYVLDNLEKIKEINNEKNLECWEDFQYYERDLPLYDKLQENTIQLMKFVQRSGPCDVFLMPMVLYIYMNELKDPSTLAQSLSSLRDFLLARLHRRFFCWDFDLLGEPVYRLNGEPDKTRKTSFFDNFFVQCAWALTPDDALDVFVQSKFMSVTRAATLRQKFKESLLKLHQIVEPFEATRANVPQKRVKGMQATYGSSTAQGNTPEERHYSEVECFRNSPLLKELFKTNILSIFTNYTVKKDMLKDLLKATESGWIRKVWRIVLAFPFSTVECERDFSWLSHLFSDKRLNLGSKMMGNYMMANKNADYISTSSSVITVKKQNVKTKYIKKKDREAKDNKKISDMFGVLSKKAPETPSSSAVTQTNVSSSSASVEPQQRSLPSVTVGEAQTRSSAAVASADVETSSSTATVRKSARLVNKMSHFYEFVRGATFQHAIQKPAVLEAVDPEEKVSDEILFELADAIQEEEKEAKLNDEVGETTEHELDESNEDQPIDEEIEMEKDQPDQEEEVDNEKVQEIDIEKVQEIDNEKVEEIDLAEGIEEQAGKAEEIELE